MPGQDAQFGGSSAGPRYASLRDHLRVLRRYRLFILIVVILVTGLAAAISAAQDPVYRGEASLEFRDPTQDIGLIGLQNGATSTPQELAAVGAEEANGRDIIAAAGRRLRLKQSVGRLDDDVNARAETQSNLVVIQAQRHSASQAARLANAVAAEVVRFENRAQRKRYDKLITSIKDEQRTTLKGKDPATHYQRLALSRNLVQLRSTRDFSNSVRVVEPASVPSSAIAPKTVRNLIVGFVAGVVVALLLAFLRGSLDRRLRGSEGLEEVHPPVLGVVGKRALGKTTIDAVQSGDADSEAELEAARVLRTNLDFLRPDRGMGCALVTSPLPGEGKSTVACNLATAVALTGKQVLLLECDLHRPVLHERLGLAKSPGLSDFLRGEAGSREVLQTVALPSHHGGNGAVALADGESADAAPMLTCVTAGTRPPALSELLASEGFADFLTTVSRAYEAVVIDSGPVLAGVDALQLVAHADVIALCVRSGRTTREELQATLEAIARVGERPTGLVITGTTPADAGDYGYHRYGYAQSRG